MEATLFTPHIGKKIERIRTWKRKTQEQLPSDIGVSRQTISKLEQAEEVDDEKLSQIAIALGVSVDEIKNFDEGAAVFQIQTMNDNSQAIYQYHFNPIDKIVELYERMLELEREKIEILKAQNKMQ